MLHSLRGAIQNVGTRLFNFLFRPCQWIAARFRIWFSASANPVERIVARTELLVLLNCIVVLYLIG